MEEPKETKQRLAVDIDWYKPCVCLKHLHNVETRFFCPQTFLSLDYQCRDGVSELE